MGDIREQLSIVDGFSQTFKTFQDAANDASSSAEALNQNLQISGNENAFANIANNVERIANSMDEVVDKQSNITAETNRTAQSSGNWLNTIKSIAASLGAMKLAETFIETADAMSQMQAKIGAINDGLQTTEQLNNMIFSSAQRSRGSYEETANLVARLGQNAKEAFGSNAEAVLFAENLNKSFKLVGATQQEQASAVLQLSQALGSGVLRGQEFNAVMSAAPNVIRTIADYMGVPVGQMRDLAAEGQITADIVKNAMLSATDSINKQFEQVPQTWSDMIQSGKNVIIYGLQEAFSDWTEFINTEQWQEIMDMMLNAVVVVARVGARALMAISNAIVWVKQNWETLAPIIATAAAAFIAYKAAGLAAAIASAAAWAIANWWLLAIAVALVQVGQMLSQAGVSFEEMGEYIGAFLGGLYASIYNVFADIWNVVAVFVEFFANVWSDPIGSIVRLFVGLFDSILNIVKRAASVIDFILGTSYSEAIEGFQNDIQEWVDQKYGPAQYQVERMEYKDMAETAQTWGKKGAEIASGIESVVSDISGGFSALDDVNSQLTGLDDLVNAVGDTGEIAHVGTVNKIEGDVKLSEEDVKILRDLAEMKYMQKIELKTLAPEINVSIPETAAGTLSAEEVAQTVQKVLIEQMSAHTATAH